MRIDDLYAPTGRFVAHVSAFVGTGENSLGRAPFWSAADGTFTPVFAVTFGATPPELPPRTPSKPYQTAHSCPRSILSENGLQFCFRTSYMSFLVFEKSSPASTIQAVTVAWSVLTTQWPEC